MKLLLDPWVAEWMLCSVQFSSVAQSCPTLCNPMNCSTPGLPVHHQLPEFTQIRFRHDQLFATPWTVVHQAPLSMGFSKQEYWSGLPFPSSGDLPDPGIKPGSPAPQADTLPSEPPGKPSWCFGSVQFSGSLVSTSLQPHELQHARPPCPSPTPGIHLP